MHVEKRRSYVTRWWVMAFALTAFFGYSASTPAHAVSPVPAVSEIIVRYELGAPPRISDGRPWGAQCVTKRDQALIQRGRWLGAGIRTIQLSRSVTQRRANRISTAFALCPYVMWAEPNAVRLVLPDDLPSHP